MRHGIVDIQRFQEGVLFGTIGTGTHLFAFGEPVLLGTDGSFLLPLPGGETIPHWARFVASRRGKKYYPISSRQAWNLVPRNRLYFATEQQAEAAGYAAP